MDIVKTMVSPLILNMGIVKTLDSTKCTVSQQMGIIKILVSSVTPNTDIVNTCTLQCPVTPHIYYQNIGQFFNTTHEQCENIQFCYITYGHCQTLVSSVTPHMGIIKTLPSPVTLHIHVDVTTTFVSPVTPWTLSKHYTHL